MIRPYTCFACETTTRNNCLPKGWFTVKVSSGKAADRLEGAGLFCSVGCLLDHFEKIETDPKKIAAIAK